MIYRRATTADAVVLTKMARDSFVATFAHLYKAADLDVFLGEAFGPDGLARQIDDPGYRIQLAIEGDAIVGFAKLGPCTLPAPATPGDAELKQLYVVEQCKGAGVADALMDWALATARAEGRTRMVLSVWVENFRAKRFYARRGFVEIGLSPFRVGDQIDDDRLWSLDL